MSSTKNNIAIIGAGNIGCAMANGLLHSGRYSAEQITLTRRKVDLLDQYKQQGFTTTSDNKKAVESSEIIVVAVEPQQLDPVLSEIKPLLQQNRHILISVVSGATTTQISEKIDNLVPVVRAMPNTAIAIRESMTCICSDKHNDSAIKSARDIFSTVGKTLVIREEQMSPATALGACGIAFFLRAIRAASQGGIEIGFSSSDALEISAQTAKGAASLLLSMKNHPEFEIDKVTTPRGCTITGLNEMEHHGFSSAMIRGILTSAEKAAKLYDNKE